MSADRLSRAATALRDSVGALPEAERRERWTVIQPDAYPSVSLDPTVVLLWADLLDALNTDLTGFEEQLTLFRTARAVTAAILREEPTDAETGDDHGH